MFAFSAFRSRTAPAIFCILLSFLGARTEAPASKPLRGKVYLDKNRNGARDEGEPGLPNVEITNGFKIVKTDADGDFIIEEPRPEISYYSLVRPAGYDATTEWFCNVTEIQPSGERNFGIASRGPSGDSRILVHFSGLNLANAKDTDNALEIAGELSKSASRPACIIATGLASPEIVNIKNLKKNSPIPIEGIEPGAFPDRYIVEEGHFRIIFVTSLDAQTVEFVLAATRETPVHKGIVIVTESNPMMGLDRLLPRMKTTATYLFEGRNCKGLVLSARDKATDQMAPRGNAYSMGPLLVAGDDGEPRSYRILQLQGSKENEPSTVTTETRALLSHRRVSFLWPQAGSAVAQGMLDVRVNAYDSFANAQTVTLTIIDSQQKKLSKLLRFDGGTLWRENVDLSNLSEGKTTGIVTIQDDSNNIWEARNSFGIVKTVPEMKISVQETSTANRFRDSRVETELAPPLRLAWSADLYKATTDHISLGGGKLTFLQTIVENGYLIGRLDAVTGNRVQSLHAADLGSLLTDERSSNTKKVELPTEMVDSDIDGRGTVRVEKLQNALRGVLLVKGEKDKITEKELWKKDYKIERDLCGAPDGKFYCIINSQLTCFDAATGDQLWQATQKLGDAPGSPFLTNNGLVAAPGADATIQAFDTKTGAWRWTFNKAANAIDASVPGQAVGRVIGGTPAVAGNYCYFGANDGRVYGVDTRSGLVRWWFRLGASVAASPIISGNALFIISRDGHVHAFCP